MTGDAWEDARSKDGQLPYYSPFNVTSWVTLALSAVAVRKKWEPFFPLELIDEERISIAALFVERIDKGESIEFCRSSFYSEQLRVNTSLDYGWCQMTGCLRGQSLALFSQLEKEAVAFEAENSNKKANKKESNFFE